MAAALSAFTRPHARLFNSFCASPFLPLASPLLHLPTGSTVFTASGLAGHLNLPSKHLLRKSSPPVLLKKSSCSATRSDAGNNNESEGKIPFGYSRKDVLLIGLGITAFGFGLKYGLEWLGFDPLKAGNVVQLLLVLGLTLGWISSYIFRVSNKEMTYAKQLKDYETKVMQKRLEELPESELEYMLAQIEEEKRRLQQIKDQMSQ